MDQLIDQITERLIRQLPEDKPYYYPQDFLNSQFPPFLIDRIVLELKRNLAESIDPPETDWADMSSESVQKAWSSFIEAIRADVRMPSSYAAAVVNNSVSDVVELMLEPRKFIPEYLFGDKDELTLEEVYERTQWLVVYPYFQRALLRYMEKKGIEVISSSRGEHIIKRIDERLTHNYDATQWAELLEPWFELIGREIDSDLFRRFFDDKNMPEIAGRFNQTDENLSRKKLIETISGNTTEDTESEQSEILTDTQQEQSEPGTAPLQDEADHEAQSIIDQFESIKPAGESTETKETDEEEDKETGIPREDEFIREEPEEEQEEENEPTLLDQNFGEETETDDEKPLYQQTLVDEEEDQESEEIAGLDEENTGQQEEYETEEETGDEEEESSGEIPMWQRFAGGNEEEEEEETPFYTKDDEEEESPIIDFSSEEEEPSDTEEYRRLMREISDVRRYFIDELFSGDDSAFERAMEHLVTFNTWKEAVKFISQEIFRRNMIDMYSDVAVEFTDRMQTFFLQKPNKED